MLITFIAFEAMAVGTAMPTAVAELDGLAWYGWPFSAFLVASVVGMVVGGDAGDRRGPRVALPWGVAVFAAGLLLAGLAGNMARVRRRPRGAGSRRRRHGRPALRDRGSGLPPSLRPRLFGAFSTAWVLPALIGPVVAGLVTTHASWRLVFLGLLPLIVVGALLVVSAGPVVHGARDAGGRGSGPPRGGRRSPAWGSPPCSTPVSGWTCSPWVWPWPAWSRSSSGCGPCCRAGTARAVPGLPTVVASRGLLAGAFFGMDALLPLTLTAVHGYSPTAAGIPLTAGAIGWCDGVEPAGAVPRPAA